MDELGEQPKDSLFQPSAPSEAGAGSTLSLSHKWEPGECVMGEHRDRCPEALDLVEGQRDYSFTSMDPETPDRGPLDPEMP